MKRIITSFILLAALCATMSSCGQQQNSIPTNKKEIMDQFLAGTLDPGYVPAGFFIHFGSDSKEGAGAVNAHIQYFLKTNQDVLKVQFEQQPARIHDLDKQETWDNIGPLPEDFYAPTLEIIKNIVEIAGKDVYVLPTIYSPYQVSRQSIGEANVFKAASERPDDIKRVLGYYADALKWLVRECKKIGVEGFYMTTQGGEMKFYSTPGFFENFIKPFDLAVMNECCKDTRINILHICDWEGPYDDLTRYTDYPGDIVNTPIIIDGKPFTLSDGEALFGRPVLGGLDRHKEIVTASEEELVEKVNSVLAEAPAGRVMLGAECTVGGASIANIHAAVSAAHHKGD